MVGPSLVRFAALCWKENVDRGGSHENLGIVSFGWRSYNETLRFSIFFVDRAGLLEGPNHDVEFSVRSDLPRMPDG